MRVAILTADTAVYKEEEEDKSGQVIKEMVEEAGCEVVFQRAVPTDRKVISTVMQRMVDNKLTDLILTTGGSGCAPTDCTPEATTDIIEKPVTGIPEAMRAHMAPMTKRAMFNRSTAGIRGDVLIVNLPGKPGAVREGLKFLLPEITHVVETIQGGAQE